MASGIYMIENLINGRLYIGSATNIDKRWKAHRRVLQRQKHENSHLQRAWNKYGSESFAFRFVETVEPEQLIAREQEYLDAYWSKGLYNISPTAGSPLGVKHPIATRNKMSEAGKGRVFSDETKAKMAEARRNFPLKDFICSSCGKTFQSKSQQNVRFCSDRCYAKFRYAQKKNLTNS